MKNWGKLEKNLFRMRTKKILLGSTYDGKGTNQGEMKEAATKKKEKADKEIFSLN